MAEPVISMRDVTIRFGSLVANDKVSLDIEKGEIMALLGENGAGKSTLMKILYGLYMRESGEITVDGKAMPRKFSPSDAIGLGIGMVPQHFMLVDSFSVAENIVLGEEQKASRLLLNKEKIFSMVEPLCKEFGIDVSPRQKVENLPLGVKQKIEILKALFRQTKILILDEPTTVLTPQEVDELFKMLRSLQKKGLTVVIITHKMHEVLAVTDRITVMRHGKHIATFNTADTNTQELARTMVGKDVASVHVEQSDAPLGEPSFVIDRVNTPPSEDRCNLKDFCLKLYPGKVVGVAGIDGNGQTELVEVLTGVRRMHSGSITAGGNTITENTTDSMRRLGIGVIPEDRIEQGLVMEFCVRDNIMMGYKGDPRFERHGIFRMKAVDRYVDELVGKYDVRPARRSAVCRYISGGNQQKVVLARELERPALQAVVASQPVRGLDVGAIQFTHQTLLRLRGEDKSILLVSSDLDEIKSLSDYIAVIRDGRIVAFKKADEFSKDEIGLYMSGAIADEGCAV
ncbi:ABC transporter ATP-binding protein [Ruminococcaceae bacterium OttesenSCG-928-D13]|nr:ABC transporter ATP-binding protein [Ruminococcaceae bacterium OttesenSCG-928-D13]